MGAIQSALILSTLLLTTFVCSEAQTSSPPSDLGGTSWQLVKFRGSDGKVVTPGDNAKFTIAFDKAGRVWHHPNVDNAHLFCRIKL
jgi:hypothetical protein